MMKLLIKTITMLALLACCASSDVITKNTFDYQYEYSPQFYLKQIEFNILGDKAGDKGYEIVLDIDNEKEVFIIENSLSSIDVSDKYINRVGVELYRVLNDNQKIPINTNRYSVSVIPEPDSLKLMILVGVLIFLLVRVKKMF